MKKFKDDEYIGDGVHGRTEERFHGKKGPGDDFSPKGEKKAEAIIDGIKASTKKEKEEEENRSRKIKEGGLKNESYD